MQKLPYRLESKVLREVEQSHDFKVVELKWDELVGGAEFKNKAYGEAFVFASMRDV